MAALHLPPILDRIRQALPPDTQIYLVGGAVRDLLLARSIHDFDFALPENALEISRNLADQLGGAYFVLDVDRQTARVIYSDEQGNRNILDFATYRGPDLESDLRDRDFTINALALDIHAPQALFDPLGGAADLHDKKLRACHPRTFSDDPVRVLRAIRMAAKLGLHIQPETREQMHQAIQGLANVSPERKRDEILQILGNPQPHTSIRALEMLGVLPYIFPELSDLVGVSQSPPHVKDVWNHTLDTLRVLEGILNLLSFAPDPDATGSLMLGILSMRLGRYRENIQAYLEKDFVTDRPLKSLLFLAALYHDIAKPQTRSVEEGGRIRYFNHDQLGAEIISKRAEALHLSNLETERLAQIIRHHMRPSLLSHQDNGPSKRAIYRFFRDTGEAGVDICLLSLADVWATYGTTLTQDRWEQQVNTVRKLLEAWWENPQKQVNPAKIITGNDLIEKMNLSAGPIVGEILEGIREAQATGRIATREEAFQFAQSYLEKKNQ
jgi:putative nucleotidyltransferase with HDIG domain